jgi:hypothetical protein
MFEISVHKLLNFQLFFTQNFFDNWLITILTNEG